MASDKIEGLKAAEEAVLGGTLTATVDVCGKNRIIRPLTSGPSKKFNAVLNKVLAGFRTVAQTPAEERSASIFGGQEELIINSMIEALCILGVAYGWPDVDVKTIEDTMTTKQIKEVVNEQVRINGDEDFLLLPSQVISQILSQTTEAVKKVGNPDSTQASAQPGTADQTR